MYRKIKQNVFNLLDDSEKDNSAHKVINYALVGLIVLNVLCVIVETVESFYNRYWAFLWTFEIFSVEIFTVEYLARLWVCNLDKRYQGAVKGRLRYILSPMAMIDFLAITPFYLPMLIPLDMRFLRALRLFRLFRLFKLSRYSESMAMFGRIARDRKEDLVITVFIVVIVLVLSSAMMYYAEHDAQPEKFDNIPDTMYWSIITLATVGYGDIYPITALGRFFSTIIALTGIALFALPAGIIGSSFIEERQKARENMAEKKNGIGKSSKCDDICPHCGKSRHEPVAGKVPEIAPLIKK